MKLYANLCIFAHFSGESLGFNKKSRVKIKTCKVFPLSEDCETKHLFLLLRPLKLDSPPTEQVKNLSLGKMVLTPTVSC